MFVPFSAAGLLVSALALRWLTTSVEARIEVPGAMATAKATPSQSSLRELWSVPGVKELSAAVFCLKFVRYCMYMWLPLYFVEHLGYSRTLVSYAEQ